MKVQDIFYGRAGRIKIVILQSKNCSLVPVITNLEPVGETCQGSEWLVASLRPDVFTPKVLIYKYFIILDLCNVGQIKEKNTQLVGSSQFHLIKEYFIIETDSIQLI